METYLITFLAWFAACFVNNIAGFGAAMVALPLMGLLGVDMAIAIPAGLLLALVVNVQLFWDCRHAVDVSRTWPVLVGVIPGAFFGASLFSVAQEGTLRIAVGVLLVLYSLWGLCMERQTRIIISRYWGVVVGFLSSGLAATIGFPGPPLIVYAAFSGWKKESVKGGLTVFFMLSSTLAIVAQIVAGIQSVQTLSMAGAGIPGVIGGGFLGIMVSRRIGEYSFRKIIYVLLMLMGLCMFR